MAKLSNKNSGGTSFFGITIETTLNKLCSVLGEPQIMNNDGSDKTNIDYTCELENGDVFTIYDWKEYRPIWSDEYISFHIGANSEAISIMAKNELQKQGV